MPETAVPTVQRGRDLTSCDTGSKLRVTSESFAQVRSGRFNSSVSRGEAFLENQTFSGFSASQN